MGRVDIIGETPGSILGHETATGNSGAEDNAMITIESMRMEIPIVAPVDGRVVESLVQPGGVVATGQPMAIVEA